MIYVTALAFVGWVLAALVYGMWAGEKGKRVFIENVKAYGHGSPQEATSWDDESPEERVEETMTKLENLMGTRVTRSGPEMNGKVEYDEETIENGVAWILEQAKKDGEQVSEAEARDEVERMLNAEGGEMV